LSSLFGDPMTADGDVGRKIREWLDADHLVIVFAECVGRLERHRNRFADLLLTERLLDLGKDAGMTAVQIRDRLAGFLDQLIACIEQLESNRHDSVGEDVHRRMLMEGKKLTQDTR